MNLILVHAENVFEEDGQFKTELEERQAEHCINVLHAEVGSRVCIGVINGGKGYGKIEKVIKEKKKEVVVCLDGPYHMCRIFLEEPRDDSAFARRVEVLIGMPRPKVFNRILQNIASLGVHRIVIVCTTLVEKSYFSSPFLQETSIKLSVIKGLEQSKITRFPNVYIYASWGGFLKHFSLFNLYRFEKNANKLHEYSYVEGSKEGEKTTKKLEDPDKQFNEGGERQVCQSDAEDIYKGEKKTNGGMGENAEKEEEREKVAEIAERNKRMKTKETEKDDEHSAETDEEKIIKNIDKKCICLLAHPYEYDDESDDKCNNKCGENDSNVSKHSNENKNVYESSRAEERSNTSSGEGDDMNLNSCNFLLSHYKQIIEALDKDDEEYEEKKNEERKSKLNNNIKGDSHEKAADTLQKNEEAEAMKGFCSIMICIGGENGWTKHEICQIKNKFSNFFVFNFGNKILTCDHALTFIMGQLSVLLEEDKGQRDTKKTGRSKKKKEIICAHKPEKPVVYLTNRYVQSRKEYNTPQTKN